MKDPAFLFYSSDFLTGVTSLTMEERGQYITLLCLQHQFGFLDEKTIRLSVANISVDVLKKFQKEDSGNYFNARLRAEIEKRDKYTDSRRVNGCKGGRPKKPYAKPYGKAKKNHSENENINENINEKGGMGEKEELSFEKVWEMYGKKGNKKTSERKWDGLPKKAKELAVVHIPKYVASTPDEKYRKNFETYLNQECWNDKIVEVKESSLHTGTLKTDIRKW